MHLIQLLGFGWDAARLRCASSQSAWCGRKIVDAEFRPQVSGQGNFIRFERNTGGVGNTDNRVENGDHCGAIDQGRATEAGLYLVACLGQMGGIRPEDRLGKVDQHFGRWNAAVRCSLAVHTAEIVGLSRMFAARPEQHDMAGRSIEALIEDRDTRRQQLDLRMRDGTVFVTKIT